MNDNEKQTLVNLLDSMSKKLLYLEEKVRNLEIENWNLNTYFLKLEVRINELESDSDV